MKKKKKKIANYLSYTRTLSFLSEKYIVAPLSFKQFESDLFESKSTSKFTRNETKGKEKREAYLG